MFGNTPSLIDSVEISLEADCLWIDQARFNNRSLSTRAITRNLLGCLSDLFCAYGQTLSGSRLWRNISYRVHIVSRIVKMKYTANNKRFEGFCPSLGRIVAFQLAARIQMLLARCYAITLYREVCPRVYVSKPNLQTRTYGIAAGLINLVCPRLVKLSSRIVRTTRVRLWKSFCRSRGVCGELNCRTT